MTARRFFWTVRWVLSVQALGVLLMGLVAYAIAGLPAGVSSGLGSLIALFPNVYFSFRFGLRDDRRTAKQVVRSFYGAEAIKLLLTVILFVAAYQYADLMMLPFLVGYIVTLSVFWFALLVHGTKL